MRLAWVHVGEGFSQEFEVKVGVYQGSVLSPLLFIIVLEALSSEFWAGVPWEDLYADDLGIIADSLEDCVRRLLIWKEACRVQANTHALSVVQEHSNNSIYCNGCKLWVHKKCSGLQRLTPKRYAWEMPVLLMAGQSWRW